MIFHLLIGLNLSCLNAFTDPARKIDFNLKLTLVCDAPWVQFPTHLDLMHMARTFAIRIDASNLPEGVHATR